jgi:hypothetical protein
VLINERMCGDRTKQVKCNPGKGSHSTKLHSLRRAGGARLPGAIACHRPGRPTRVVGHYLQSASDNLMLQRPRQGRGTSGAYVSSRRTLTIRSWGLITPAAALVGRLVYRQIVRTGRFDRMIRCVGLRFAGHIRLSGRLGIVDVLLHYRPNPRSSKRPLSRAQATLDPLANESFQ